MPEAPQSNLFTYYVLENPWPLGLALLAIAAILTWMGLREGLRGRTRTGLVFGVLGAAVIAAGLAVTTAGEQAKRLTRQLVDAAVAKDLVTGMTLFSDDATMNAGSPQNPGFDREFIKGRFAALAERHTIESNSISTLRYATISSDEAEARLGCLTTVAAFPYPNTSQWIIRVMRQPDGQWKITRLTCVAINDQTPPLDRIW